MRKVGAIIMGIFETGFWSSFIFVKLKIRDKVFRLTTLPYDFSFVKKGDNKYNDGAYVDLEEYKAAVQDSMGIVNFTPQNLSTSVDKSEITIGLADPEFILRSYAREASISGLIEIRGGLINTLGRDLSYKYDSMGKLMFSEDKDEDTYFFRDGEAILDPKQTCFLYKGYVSRITYNLAESKGILAEIEGASPMGALDTNNLWFTTHANLSQKKIYNKDSIYFSNIEGSDFKHEVALKDDTCLSYLFKRNSKVSMSWGQNVKYHKDHESSGGFTHANEAYRTSPTTPIVSQY